jgi:hypothetical protein
MGFPAGSLDRLQAAPRHDGNLQRDALSMPPMTSSRYRTTPFFVIALAITWGLQFPGVLAQRGIFPGDPNAYMPLVGLGILGPLLAATMLTFREGGKAAVKQLYAPLLLWRFHPR